MPKRKIKDSVRKANNHGVTNPEKRHFTYTIRDAYKIYRKEISKEITYKQYRDVLRGVLGALTRKVIIDSWTFYLPFKLGALSRISKDQTSEDSQNPVDYNESAKRGKVIYHLNFHSMRRKYRVKWIHSFVKFQNKKYYVYKTPGGTLADRYNTGRSELKRFIEQSAIDNDIKLIK